MPPAKKKDYSVVLYDLNMRNKNMAKDTIYELFGRNEFATKKKSEMQLILLGTKDNANEDEFAHISLIPKIKNDVHTLSVIDQYEGEYDDFLKSQTLFFLSRL